MNESVSEKARHVAVAAFILFFLFSVGCAEAGPAAPWKGRQPAEPVFVPATRMAEPWRRIPRREGILGMVHRWENYLIARRSELALEDSQVDRIESILQAHRKYLIRTGADLRILRMEVRELLVKEKIDLVGVEEKVKALDNLAAGRVMETVRTFEKVLAVLTPEQQKKANAFFRESLLRW